MAIGFGVASLLLPSLLVAALVPFVSILFSVAAAFLAFRIMTGMGDRAPILWAIGMFVPLIDLIVLVALSARVQTWCGKRGIAVGLLGPTPASLADFRRIIAMNERPQ
jgi:hypothetical protein